MQEDADIPTMQGAWESLELARIVFSRFVLTLTAVLQVSMLRQRKKIGSDTTH